MEVLGRVWSVAGRQGWCCRLGAIGCTWHLKPQSGRVAHLREQVSPGVEKVNGAHGIGGGG